MMKKDDPFMYYSIPAVRNARLQDKEMVLPSSSAPKMANDAKENKSMTTRKTCISFECHPDILIEEMVLETSKSKVDESSSGLNKRKRSMTFMED